MELDPKNLKIRYVTTDLLPGDQWDEPKFIIPNTAKFADEFLEWTKDNGIEVRMDIHKRWLDEQLDIDYIIGYTIIFESERDFALFRMRWT